MPEERKMRSRRHILQSAGAIAALAALRGGRAWAAGPGVTERLARYMVAARDQELPAQVVIECKHRILDTLGAMVSVCVPKTLSGLLT
jgi:hypothetical protein